MRKKEDNFELKLYESLGIKTFRKLAFFLRDIIVFPLALITGNSWEEEKRENNKYASNYNIGTGNGVKDLKNYKIGILANTSVHIFCLYRLIPTLVSIISGTSVLSVGSMIYRVIMTLLNCYCLMLQRYNWIRLNKTIKRLDAVETKKRKKIIDDIKREDSLVEDHTYQVFNSKWEKKEISFDDLLDKATLDQLRKCRDYIKSFQNVEESRDKEDNSENVGVIRLGNKRLILELKEK